jgi:multimeric flavodoxin WrbA
LGWVEDELRAGLHEVEHVDIADCNIGPCMEDLVCQTVLDAPGCSMQDGGPEMFDRILAADLVILASPVFAWGFTAQIKALIDRCICLCKVSEGSEPVYLLEGKHIALVSTAGGPIEGNMDLLSRVFQCMAEYMRFKNAGELLIPSCTTPEDLGDDVEEKARAFAHTIADSIRPPV